MRSLFDRISEPQKTDFVSQKDVQIAEIKSIERELNCLLNTRSYLGGKKLSVAPGASRTLLNYGMDDVVSAGSRISGKLENITSNVREAIEHYEPRLTSVVVTSEYYNNNPMQMLVNVSARLRQTQEPIQYKIPLTIPTAEA
ncbi:MAG: type VI secretion system baseplate subunit TssE [Pseudomonadota bacterium]